MGLENPVHIIIILAVILMLFGAKRLPEMGKGLGSGIRGFKEGLTTNETPAQVHAAPTDPVAQTAQPAAPVAEPVAVAPEPVATPVAPATESTPERQTVA